MRNGSMVSAIFRFSNQDGPVIQLHQEYLEGLSGYVWWGWWKKEHEARRDETLSQLETLIRRHGKIEVAFLNRKDEEYYRAVVDGVQYLTGGERSHAPDERCPDLYRDRDPGCPAWLRVREITPISSYEYSQVFGDIPTGDPTLYEVRRLKNDTLVAYPLPTWDMRPLDTPGDTLLHLSDVHFGASHGYQQTVGRVGDSVKQVRLIDRILEAVELSQTSVGVVVLSGDLVSKGNTDDFFLVEDFLAELLRSLGLTKQHLVVVPGNHDFKTLQAVDSMPTMDYSHERPFRNFLRSYLDWKGSEIERLQHFKLANDERVVFGALNSARLRGHETKEYGYVGRHRYAEMFDYMNQSLERTGSSARRVAVLHHHVLPVQEQEVPRDGVPISLTVDAAELFGELQERGFDAIMHGHQHRPFYFRGTRSVFRNPTDVFFPAHPLVVIGNGATGAGGDALVPDFPFNCLGLHRMRKDALQLSWYYFGPTIAPNRLAGWEVSWANRFA